MIERIANGRTDLVFDYLAQGHPANSTDSGGVSLIKWCAYYGDVSAIKFLLGKTESLQCLGKDLGLKRCSVSWTLAAVRVPDRKRRPSERSPSR